MTFAEPIRTTRTFEAAIESIVDGIARARLRQGDRIPNEGELSRELGISKPTLRQALRVLERSGLLAVRQGKGGGIFLTSDLLPLEAISSNIALEEDAVVDVLVARRVLETVVTEFAVTTATAEDFDEIERTNDLLRGHLNARRALMLRADAMFHRAVGRATHNLALQESMRGLARRLAPIRDHVRDTPEELLRVLAIHERQLEAMRARDFEALAAALDVHFRFLEESFARELGKTWDEVFGARIAAAA